MPQSLGNIAVPCPYFLPKERLKETGWAVPPRAPLGVLCSGECHAEAAPQPADHELCNFGYARGVCGRFPADASVDAVRFAITAREGDVVHVRYLLERAYAPQGSGRLTYDVAKKRMRGAEAVPILAAQAAAFVLT